MFTFGCYHRVQIHLETNWVEDKTSESWNKERSVVLFVSGKHWVAPVSCAAIDRGVINEVVARRRDP